MINLKTEFAKHADCAEYLKFDRVEPKLSRRPDLHAFLLLDRLVPGIRDIIGCAEPFLAHTRPECPKFKDLEITDFLHAVNVALGMHN